MTGNVEIRRGGRAAVGAYCVLAAFVLALLWPLVCGRALYWGDLIVYFEPMGDYLQTSLQAGRIPLWNPYVLGGQPYVGNPQMGVFYPNTLLLYVMPVWAALSLSLEIHLFLCGAFTFAYLRRWTERDVSALAGGMIYAGSACLVGRMQFPPMVYSAAYLPLLLLLVDRQIERPALKTCLQMAAAFGLMLLAAHTQMAYFEILLVAAYLGTRAFRRFAIEKLTGKFPDGAARRRWILRMSAPFFMSGLLGMGLCAAQVIPAAQLLGESPRERMTVGTANRFFLEGRQLLTLVFPRFTGHPANGDYHAAGNVWEPAIFIGWIPLVLIGFAMKDWRSRKIRYAALTAGLGVWLAFGIAGGLYPLAFAFLPGLSKFHDPARFLYFTTFGFAALSAFGMDKMRRVSGVGYRVSDALLIGGIALPLIFYGQDWNPTTAAAGMNSRANTLVRLRGQGEGAEFVREGGQGVLEREFIPGAVPPKFPASRVYLPEYSLVWVRYISYFDFGRNDARTLKAFSDTLMPNMGMKDGIEGLSGYEPVPLYAPLSMEELTEMQLFRGEPNATKLMAMLNANSAMTLTSWNLPNPRLIPLHDGKAIGGMKAYANRDALPRFWLVRHTRRVEGRMRIPAALSDSGFNPANEAVISCGLNDALANETSGTNWNFATEEGREEGTGKREEGNAQYVAEGDGAEGVRVISESPHEAALTAEAGERPAYLVASLMAYPGWRAEVDGKKTIPLRTDGAIMGIPLAPGAHRVTFRYNPAAYRFGLYLSLLACGTISLGAGYLAASRSREKRP